MRRIRKMRLGLRLGIAFALTASLLCITLAVSLTALTSERHAEQRLADDITLTLAFNEAEDNAISLKAWQNGYTLEANLDGARAVEDGASRKAFLESAAQ